MVYCSWSQSVLIGWSVGAKNKTTTTKCDKMNPKPKWQNYLFNLREINGLFAFIRCFARFRDHPNRALLYSVSQWVSVVKHSVQASFIIFSQLSGDHRRICSWARTHTHNARKKESILLCVGCCCFIGQVESKRTSSSFSSPKAVPKQKAIWITKKSVKNDSLK